MSRKWCRRTYSFQGRRMTTSTAAATSSGRQRRQAAAKSPASAAATKSVPSFFVNSTPAKQSVATASAQRSSDSNQRAAAATPTANTSASGRAADAVSNWSKTAGANAIAPSSGQSRSACTRPEDCPERRERGHEEEQELDVEQASIERAHRAEVDRLERRQPQRVVEVR